MVIIHNDSNYSQGINLQFFDGVKLELDAIISE